MILSPWMVSRFFTSVILATTLSLSPSSLGFEKAAPVPAWLVKPGLTSVSGRIRSTHSGVGEVLKLLIRLVRKDFPGVWHECCCSSRAGGVRTCPRPLHGGTDGAHPGRPIWATHHT